MPCTTILANTNGTEYAFIKYAGIQQNALAKYARNIRG